MKNIILFIFLLSLNSCLITNNEKLFKRRSASELIIQRINFIEKQFEKYERGRKADFSQIEEIINLSNISPKEWSGNWDGAIYIPDKNIIKEWKIWYNKNKDYFYFDPNNDCLVKLHLSKKERNYVVFISINDSLTRNSFSLNISKFCN